MKLIRSLMSAQSDKAAAQRYFEKSTNQNRETEASVALGTCFV